MKQTLITPDMHDWAKASLSRIGKRVPRLQDRRKRKMVVIHLDGVPKSVLDTAVADGTMPFFSQLVRSGAYHLDSAFWGSPASTPAFQAGLLYGIRHPNLPAYNWFDRELGRPVRMNKPSDALNIEGRLDATTGQSLFGDGGTSYLSLFQGQASNRLCMSALAEAKTVARTFFQDQVRHSSAARHQHPLAFLSQVVRETFRSGVDAFRWWRRVRDFRHEKEFFLNRFFLITLMWELAHSRTLIDMVRGVPAIYLVFGNFDEVAHRRGPFSAQAKRELVRADRAFRELYAMSQALDEPYDIFFVTDHGHVDSAPFERRVGQRLEKFLLEGAPVPLSPEIERGLLHGREPLPVPRAFPRDEPVVIEAGNFSHVYLTRERRALEARELLARYPQVIARASRQPDIGIVALRRGDSAVAIIQGGVYAPHEIESAPLASEFSKRAVADLLTELPHMKTAGDLVLYGEATHRGGTVGFAWEFGSHGGLTRTETDSVVCWPSDAPVDLRGLGHCVQLHEKLSEVYRN
jgi:hypothetical protein